MNTGTCQAVNLPYNEVWMPHKSTHEHHLNTVRTEDISIKTTEQNSVFIKRLLLCELLAGGGPGYMAVQCESD